jgi:outer membrane protein assembly factor BamE (lipoprotein component of BamABCDE complex)
LEITMAGQASRKFSGTVSAGAAVRLAAAFGLAASLSACTGYDGVINHGAVIDNRKVEQVKPGMAAPQVMQLMGTPSTTSTIGGDAWYYVSQRTERSLAFMPQKITDQRVVAIYFDKSRKVERIGDYGLEDGKPVNFLSRTTPVAGPDYHLIQSLLAKVSL